MFDHAVERNALRTFGENEDLALVFIRQEAFGDHNKEIDRCHQDCGRHRHGGDAMSQRELQRAIVNPQHAIEKSLEQRPQASVMSFRFLRSLQEPAAQHGSETE